MGNGAGLVLLGAGAVVMLVVFAFIGLAIPARCAARSCRQPRPAGGERGRPAGGARGNRRNPATVMMAGLSFVDRGARI